MRKVMQESPLIRAFQEEAREKALVQARREALLDVLRFRFEKQAAEVADLEKRLQEVTKSEAMQRLYKQAFTCATLLACEESVRHELAPPAASTRGKRRSGKPSA
jgi:hypothetical protein